MVVLRILKKYLWSYPRCWWWDIKDSYEWFRDDPSGWWAEHTQIIWPQFWAQFFVCPFKGHGDWVPDQCNLREHDECGLCGRVTRTHVYAEANQIMKRYRNIQSKIWLEIEQRHAESCPRKDIGSAWTRREVQCDCWVSEVMRDEPGS